MYTGKVPVQFRPERCQVVADDPFGQGGRGGTAKDAKSVKASRPVIGDPSVVALPNALDEAMGDADQIQ